MNPDLTNVEDLLHYAWGIICNSRSWDDDHEEVWEAAKIKFRDAYHQHLGVSV